MKNFRTISNKLLIPFLAVLVFTVFWSGILRDDATPSGDGSRIAPFIKMFDHHESVFPMWGPRNGGEPLLASPERFYLLGYLMDWGESSNLLLNVVIFLILLSVSLCGFLLARALGVNKLLSFLYALSLTINGLILETERSARIQSISILALSILVIYLYLSKNKYNNWLIPTLIAASIYNGIHYSALVILSFIVFSYMHGKTRGVIFSLKCVLRGGMLSLPFLLPVILHPIFNGGGDLNDLKYSISTVSFDFFIPTNLENYKSFLGYQIYLFVPALVASYLYKKSSLYWLLLPILPWVYFVVAHYVPEIKTLIETSLISNWRHSQLFYRSFLIFGYLYIVASISSFPDESRRIFSALFIILLSTTFITLYEPARSEHREKDNKVLHISNADSRVHKLLESSGELFELKQHRVYYSGHGRELPESRVFQGFSYFNGHGFSAFLGNLDGADNRLRTHWARFSSPCDGFNISQFSYAGYAYLICTKEHQQEYLNTNGYSLIDSLGGHYLYKKSDSATFGESCNPSLEVREAAKSRCDKRAFGEAVYSGNTIHAVLDVDEKTSVFFHENFAWGWLGTINGEFRLPRKVNNVFVGYELETGSYEICMYYVDPFFVLGFLLLIIYFVVERYLILRVRFSSSPCETHQ